MTMKKIFIYANGLGEIWPTENSEGEPSVEDNPKPNPPKEEWPGWAI